MRENPKESQSRPVSDLSRYLKRKAPTIDVSGMRQSRRIEGQFSGQRESRSFREVHFWVHSEIDPAAPCVRGVCKDIARFQRNEERGDYGVHYHLWGAPGSASAASDFRVAMGMNCSGGTLLRPLVDLVAGSVQQAALRHRATRLPGKEDLNVVFTSNNDQIVPDDLIGVMEHAGKGRCIWVLTEDELFAPERDFGARRAQTEEEEVVMSQEQSRNAVLHGYSERGVVNAVFEELVAAGDIELFRDFLGLIVPFNNESKVRLPEFDAFEVYIEPSLSDFGAPDVLVFLTMGGEDKSLYFIEAKLEPFLRSSPPTTDCPQNPGGKDWPTTTTEKYQENASTVLHELYLKASFVAALRGWLPGNMTDGIEHIYCADKKGRKVGRDPMVLALARRIAAFVGDRPDGKGGIPSYVAMTTDIPAADQSQILWMAGAVFDLNSSKERLKDVQLARDFSDHLMLLSWGELYSWAKGSRPSRMRRTLTCLEANEVKFIFPRQPLPITLDAAAKALRALIEELPSTKGHKVEVPARASEARRTIKVGGLGFVTLAVETGFSGGILDLYVVQDELRKAIGRRLSPPTIRLPANSLDSLEPVVVAVDSGGESSSASVLNDLVREHVEWIARRQLLKLRRA